VKRSRPFFAPRGRTSLERLARGMLLLGVFALAVVAYQHYFRGLAEEMAAKGTVADRLQVLSREDRAWLLGQAAGLRRRFGLELAVCLGGLASPPGPDDPRKLYVYYDPDCRRSLVAAPALIASALPEGFLEDLGREHLDAACREGRAREGVLATVGLVTTTLGEAASRGRGEGS
jgi:hypothetical protein